MRGVGCSLGYSIGRGCGEVSAPNGDRIEDKSGRKRVSHVRPHALIVTNDEDLRDFLQEGLTLGGFWVSIIASAIQTLEVFRLRSFDLVLIDRALAGLDALELVRRLRRQPDNEIGSGPRTDVPILLVVDHDNLEAEAAIAAGVDTVLAPPIDLDTLVPTLHQIVLAWRARHPDRPWANQVAQLRPD